LSVKTLWWPMESSVKTRWWPQSHQLRPYDDPLSRQLRPCDDPLSHQWRLNNDLFVTSERINWQLGWANWWQVMTWLLWSWLKWLLLQKLIAKRIDIFGKLPVLQWCVVYLSVISHPSATRQSYWEPHIRAYCCQQGVSNGEITRLLIGCLTGQKHKCLIV
jgi:hypothetical protein